jgi:hypothetical protein
MDVGTSLKFLFPELTLRNKECAKLKGEINTVAFASCRLIVPSRHWCSDEIV